MPVLLSQADARGRRSWCQKVKCTIYKKVTLDSAYVYYTNHMLTMSNGKGP